MHVCLVYQNHKSRSNLTFLWRADYIYIYTHTHMHTHTHAHTHTHTSWRFIYHDKSSLLYLGC